MSYPSDSQYAGARQTWSYSVTPSYSDVLPTLEHDESRFQRQSSLRLMTACLQVSSRPASCTQTQVLVTHPSPYFPQ